MGSYKSGDCKQRIEMEKYFYPPDVILSRKTSFDQKIEKKAKKYYLAEDSEGLNNPVFFRSFSLQFSTSPD